MTTAIESAPPSARRRRGPGRPRHADTEPRAYAAALSIFGRRGWAGLTLDGVASEAGIGKSSIYLRWDGKRELLTEAIEYLAAQHSTPDTSGMGLSEHLVAHAQARAELYLGEYGPAMIELYAAAAGAPEDFADLCLRDVSRGMHGSAPRVREAIEDGELATGTDVVAFLDAIEGGLMVNAVVARARGDHQRASAFAEHLVHQQLEGVRA